MKQIVFIIILTLTFSCDSEVMELVQDPVQIRLSNSTGFTIEDVLVVMAKTEMTYSTLEPNEVSEYKMFDQGWRQMNV